jgi:hypothetical protein
MGTEPVKSRKQAENVLIRQAQQDATFRRELIANPSAAIGKTFGVPLPSDLKISVLEETDRQVYLILPAKSARGGQLADSELARVAGGKMEDKDESDVGKIKGFFGSEEGLAD